MNGRDPKRPRARRKWTAKSALLMAGIHASLNEAGARRLCAWALARAVRGEGARP